MSICPASRRSSSAFWSGMISICTRSRYGSGVPSGGFPEIVRVAGEDEALPRFVAGQHERAEADDLRRRRGQAPRVRERAGLERRLELVPRQDRQVVQHADAGARTARET